MKIFKKKTQIHNIIVHLKKSQQIATLQDVERIGQSSFNFSEVFFMWGWKPMGCHAGFSF